MPSIQVGEDRPAASDRRLVAAGGATLTVTPVSSDSRQHFPYRVAVPRRPIHADRDLIDEPEGPRNASLAPVQTRLRQYLRALGTLRDPASVILSARGAG